MSTTQPDTSETTLTPSPKRKTNNEAKLLLIAAAVVLFGFGSMYFLSNLGANGGKPAPAPTPRPPLTVADVDKLYDGARHKKGDASAKLTIVEFADFQCPSCRRAYENTMKTWDTKMPAHRFGFYHLPLVNVHERAMPAAVASEAADKQGKFWDMYTAFFQEENEDLSDKTIAAVAKKIGLDVQKFQADVAQQNALEEVVNKDANVALSNGFESTPTFLIRDDAGNTVHLAGAGNLKRLLPDLKDGILGNDAIEKSDNPDAKPDELIQYNIGGKEEIR